MSKRKQYLIQEGDKTLACTVKSATNPQREEDEAKQQESMMEVQRQLLENQPGIHPTADMVSKSYNLESTRLLSKQSAAYGDRSKAKIKYLESQFTNQERKIHPHHLASYMSKGIREEKHGFSLALRRMGWEEDLSWFENGDLCRISVDLPGFRKRQWFKVLDQYVPHYLKRLEQNRRSFASLCYHNEIMAVKEEVEKLKVGSKTRNELLDRRNTQYRFSPLMLAVIGARDWQDLDMIKMMLSLGARADCRDVLGKTLLHYAVQKRELPLALSMINILIPASKCAKYMGTQVMLKDATSEHNEQIGTLAGYDADTQKCYFHIVHKEKTKPKGKGKKAKTKITTESILVDPSTLYPYCDDRTSKKSCFDKRYNLVNIQDRLGKLCINLEHPELNEDGSNILSIFEYLMTHYNIHIDVACSVGNTLRPFLEHRIQQGRDVNGEYEAYCKFKTEEAKTTCAYCGKHNTEFMCSRCDPDTLWNSYCGAKCQRKHYREHTRRCICKEMTNEDEPGTVVKIPSVPCPYETWIDDYFWVKLSPEGPHLIVSDRLESMDFCMENMKGKEGVWTGIYEKAAEHGHIMMKAVIRQKNIPEFHMFVKTARVGDWFGLASFITNGSGRAKKKNVRACPSTSGLIKGDGDPIPLCLNGLPAYSSDPCTLIPSLEAGTFLYYSRGPVTDWAGDWNTAE